MARTVTAHLFSSVNGVTESPNEWQFGAFGPEEGELMGRVIGPVTDMVLGRTLFTEWSQFWPSMPADDPFAQYINPLRKHVVTSTLEGDLGWNATRIEGDPVEYVRALKEGEGGDISVGGGIETVRTLFLGGVVDRLILTTHPVVGVGRRLFDESVPVTRLELLEAVPTSVGNVILTYALRPTD
ncbi:dihydrofolate reductase family protein [Phycicoccus sonneratiae]|uniref:Dihydrofolate reductase family protein n=1 Tax=Phycicoccus sonneratiae TaxID=2807628 RepID=A0ABS2CLU3_9MICO|nr:dihydrofolate reductase family protein [Phycicoccus sonneraticus]MBM6400044.1 dihydrofolate reductase family protein [Phycicoccus sonneraticus]